MANEVLTAISRNEEELGRLLYEESQLMTYYSDLEYAMDEGLEKGREEKLKEAIERAGNALAEGIPIDIIHKLTGLDLEMIKSLKGK